MGNHADTSVQLGRATTPKACLPYKHLLWPCTFGTSSCILCNIDFKNSWPHLLSMWILILATSQQGDTRKLFMPLPQHCQQPNKFFISLSVDTHNLQWVSHLTTHSPFGWSNVVILHLALVLPQTKLTYHLVDNKLYHSPMGFLNIIGPTSSYSCQ